MNNPYKIENPLPTWMSEMFIFYNVEFLSGLKKDPNYK